MALVPVVPRYGYCSVLAGKRSIFFVLDSFSDCPIAILEAPEGRKAKFIFASELAAECSEPRIPLIAELYSEGTRWPGSPAGSLQPKTDINTRVAVATDLRPWCQDKCGKSTTPTQLNIYLY